MPLSYIHLVMLNTKQLAQLRRAEGSPNRVRAAMGLGDVTQVQVAAAIGVTQPHVSEIVNGNYSSLPLPTAQRLAAFFGCAIEDLFPSRAA